MIWFLILLVGWLMKIIGKMGSGKTAFVVAFTNFLINHLEFKFKIYLVSPTHDESYG